MPGIARIAVSGRPEDTCDQRPEPGKAGIGSFGWEMLLGGERGYRRAAATAEERPDHFGGLRTDTLFAMTGSGEIAHARTQAELLAAIGGVLNACRATGELCADVTAEDMAASLIGIFTVARPPEHDARASRLLNIVMDGLHPEPPTGRVPGTNARTRLPLVPAGSAGGRTGAGAGVRAAAAGLPGPRG